MAEKSSPKKFPPRKISLEKSSLWHQLKRHDWASNLGIFAYASAAVALPVLLIDIMSDFGTSLDVGGRSLAAVLGLARNIAITLSLMFSGFASLRWGTRRCLRFALMLSGTFMLLSALSPSYLVLLAALVLIGIGEGLIEGLLTPFVEELHRDEADNCNRYVNLAHSFWPAGVISTTIVVGLLLNYGLDWRWLMAGIAALYPLPIMLMRPDRHSSAHTRTPAASLRNSMQQMYQVLRFGPFWRFSCAMFLAGGAEISLTFWAASFVQLNYGSSAFIGGLSTALFALGMLLGRMVAAHYLAPVHMRQAILWCTLFGVVTTTFLALTGELWLFLALLFLAGLSTATYWPTIQVYTVQKFPKLNSTILFILLSAAGVPGAGFFPWLLGLVSDVSTNLALSLGFPSSLALSLLIVPLCHFGIFVLLRRK